MKKKPRKPDEVDKIAKDYGWMLDRDQLASLTARVAALEGKANPEPSNDPDIIKALSEERERLWDVIRWALGESGEFHPRQPGEGPYWWRKEMRRRLGAKAAGTKPPLPQPTAEVAHPPEPVVGMVYRLANTTNGRRWKWHGNGVASHSWNGNTWGPISSMLGESVRSFVRSGELVPVPGYKVEVQS